MKKLVFMFVAMAAISFAACDNKPAAAPEAETPETTEVAAPTDKNNGTAAWSSDQAVFFCIIPRPYHIIQAGRSMFFFLSRSIAKRWKSFFSAAHAPPPLTIGQPFCRPQNQISTF